MEKSLLVCTGSPRAGSNSRILALEAARGAREAGALVEVVNLSRLRINPCRACARCRERGPGRCVQKDDMKNLYPLIKEAGAILLAHPVYWFTINAQTKLFIDRWYAFGQDEYACFREKKIGLILTYADCDVFSSGGVNALRAYQDIFAYLGARIAGTLYCTVSGEDEVRKRTNLLKQARQLGIELVS
ncbi:MAG: NAD(P)H-dependent oxidoreductase [Candidatus Saccharicenans sp.]|nr:NAD(P)H-dependent oxidoreductase [Candidatus Saccharicenans sp.]